MTDQDLVIELEPDDTQGHAALRVTDDEGWLKERLGRDPGATRITLKASDDDVEGHAIGTAVTLRAFGDDDTEGHAIAVHFPSRQEADAFRKRLMVTGVIVGAVALGAVAATGLDSIQAESGAGTLSATGVTDPARDAGLMDFGAGSAAEAAAATGVTDANRDVGLMDVGAGSAAGAAAATGVTDANRDVGLMDRGGSAPAAGEADDVSGRRNIGGPTPD